MRSRLGIITRKKVQETKHIFDSDACSTTDKLFRIVVNELKQIINEERQNCNDFFERDAHNIDGH